ncbi:MAG: hypothetical protein KDI68_15025 [Gammaproteobacteria bacterium]|nr:hypothetical protein [Gammaproteobacteria bacterium]
MGRLNVAWWNLENLFDHEIAQRDPALKRTLGSELKGRTAAVRDRKISQLASVIRMMFEGEGPALLGVCEIENETVAALLAEAIALPHRSYQVVSHDSPDVRGVDNSFIVDANTLSVVSTDHQIVNKRRSTRDIFWARAIPDACATRSPATCSI